MTSESGSVPSVRGTTGGSARAASPSAAISRAYRSSASRPAVICLTIPGAPSNSTSHTRDRGLLASFRTTRTAPSVARSDSFNGG